MSWSLATCGSILKFYSKLKDIFLNFRWDLWYSSDGSFYFALFNGICADDLNSHFLTLRLLLIYLWKLYSSCVKGTAAFFLSLKWCINFTDFMDFNGKGFVLSKNYLLSISYALGESIFPWQMYITTVKYTSSCKEWNTFGKNLMTNALHTLTATKNWKKC